MVASLNDDSSHASVLESFRTGVLSSEQAKTGALVTCVFGADKKTVRAPMLSEAVAADSR